MATSLPTMAPQTGRPREGAAPFEPGEVFFSRTDPRGVILSGNPVFQRVADYGWEELIGAPHKIIRHEDMPKGVFYILWDRIQNGQSVGAYVKNKARDGLFYWVFAVVTPCDGGYLSARIKPTSARRAVVEELYGKLCAAEAAGASPEISAQRISEAVQTLGFDSYEDFAADSLAEELLSEAEAASWPAPARIVTARALLEDVEDLSQSAESLLTAFKRLTSVPRNLQIKAKQIEPTGGPLTALSVDYERMSREMSVKFVENVIGAENNFDKIGARIKQTLMNNGTREILTRCFQQLSKETAAGSVIDASAEREMLGGLIAAYSKRCQDDLATLDAEAARLSRACKDMRRALLGLNTVRVTGKIENARLGGTSTVLSDILADLGQSQDDVEKYLNAAKGQVDHIWRDVQRAVAVEAQGRSPVPKRKTNGA